MWRKRLSGYQVTATALRRHTALRCNGNRRDGALASACAATNAGTTGTAVTNQNSFKHSCKRQMPYQRRRWPRRARAPPASRSRTQTCRAQGNDGWHTSIRLRHGLRHHRHRGHGIKDVERPHQRTRTTVLLTGGAPLLASATGSGSGSGTTGIAVTDSKMPSAERRWMSSLTFGIASTSPGCSSMWRFTRSCRVRPCKRLGAVKRVAGDSSH
jgi:hypothetical protein